MPTSDTVAELPKADFDAAKAMLRDLFEIMGIKNVVVVDDQLSTPLDFQKIVGAIRAKTEGVDEVVDLKIPEFAEIDVGSPFETWRDKLEAAWSDLGMERKDAIGRELGILEEPESKESERHILDKILGEIKPSFLSLTEWRAQRAELVAAAKQGVTLFLFDQDMSENQGGRTNEGMNIIAELLKNDCQDGPVYFGLFSNSVGANDEYEHHVGFMEEFGLEQMGDRFAVISKKGLDAEPHNLACRLKRVAISPRCGTLKNGLFTAINEAMQDAKTKIEGLHIYDFEHIVFRSSHDEGVWEVDTLLRLFSAFFRDSARGKAAADNAIRVAANEVRRVVSFPYRPNDAPMGKVREVARLEMYESAEYMQMHHIPLEVGDIFKKGDSKQHYMLLEQPCDLMVRGSVKNKGKRLVESVTLAEIFYVKVEADGKVKAPNASTKLEYYSTEAGKEAFVRLEKCITVPVCILDLCVCGDDGKAKLEVGKACPEGMIPAWQERYKILQAKASQLLIQYQGLIKPQGKEVPVTPAIKQALQANLLQSVPGLVTGSIDLDAKRIEYAIQRVGKLRQPWAGGVLRDYAYHKARDAFDHDWTRTEKQ